MPRIRAETIAQHKTQTRAAIIDAAIDAFYTHGYGGVSFGTIADLAAIPRSTLYDYFPDKHAVIQAIVEERVPPLIAKWVERLPDDDPLARLEAIFVATFEMAVAHPRMTAVVMGAGRGLPRDMHHEYLPVAWTVVDELERICRWGIDSGTFAPDDPDTLAAALTDLLAGGVEELLGRDRPQQSLASVTKTRVRIVRNAVVPFK